jgi:CubicO group peptidase (beta-lactamase class C family)
MAALALLFAVGAGATLRAQTTDKDQPMTPNNTTQEPPTFVDWATGTPESQGMDSAKLLALWKDLQAGNTTSLLVIRNDRIVFERYAEGYSRTKKHYTASLAKALVGGLSLQLATEDGRIHPDDPVSKYVSAWGIDPKKRAVTVRHLATHTSGLEDAEQEGVPHEQLPGWKGEFWKRRAPPQDPFTLARDVVPVQDVPGTRKRYSNPGMALLSYCVTASLKGAKDTDLRSLLKHRIMEPLGVSDAEWSCGYGETVTVDGLPLVASWGGGAYSPNAIARIGRLMLRKGEWNGRQLLSASAVATATTHAGMPNNAGLGWWVNQTSSGKLWNAAPEDTFWGAGAGHQVLLVVPSRNLIVVRQGGSLDPGIGFDAALERHLVAPLMQALIAAAPYPPSPVIASLSFAPADTILRRATDSDNWPLTWGDDDALYTAYGDGRGFDPRVPEKLSLGLARVSGSPTDFVGVNIRSATGEQKGDGARGKKASGMLMVDGTLYMWVRNAQNSQLAWSTDHGATWNWCDWRFTTSFGSPSFLNFGKNYAGARDGHVYIYSADNDSAYLPADRMVLARVPKTQIRDRAAYEFLARVEGSVPIWTRDITRRGAVFTHPGHCLRSQVSYNPVLKRYLWWQQLRGTGSDQADSRFSGGLGIYDAPEPWGPWTTVYFTTRWDVGPGETGSFPTKWMSGDGKTLYLVFSGNDAFSVRKATLTLHEKL